MGILTIQNDFTHGEVSRAMVGRSDIELYKKSAKKLRNMLVIPTGGAKRRFGTSIVGKIIAKDVGTHEVAVHIDTNIVQKYYFQFYY